MATEIPSARISPQNDRGVLKFYEGDTFTMNLHLDLKDQDGEAIHFDNDTDTFKLTFYNKKNTAVKEFTYGVGGTSVTEDTCEIDFTDVVTALFPKGEYHYDGIWKRTGFRRVTIISDAQLCVL